MSSKHPDKKTTPQYLAVQIDEGLKKEFSEFCARHYLTVSDAVLMLARQTIKTHKIPFRVEDQDTLIDGQEVPERSKPTRLSVRMSREMQEAFAAACEDIGITRSSLVRMFFGYCVMSGHLPRSWADE